MAHCAVPLDSPHHEVLDVDHAGSARLHPDHVETLTGQVVTRYERNLLTLGEGAGLTAQRAREEEEEEEQRRGGEHGRTERKEVKQTQNVFLYKKRNIL